MQPLQLLHVACNANDRGEMTTGRAAASADAVGIKAVLPGVRPHPADGRLAVVNLSRPDRFVAQPIGDGHRGVVAGERQLGQDPAPLALVTALPAAAVDIDDHGEHPIPLILGAEHIERQAAVARAAIFHVGFKGDAIRDPVFGLGCLFYSGRLLRAGRSDHDKE